MIQPEPKSARLDARLPEPVLELLRRAAAIQGRTLSDFVVNSAREAAERAISDHELLVLSAADQQQFADALLNPPPVAEPLRDAAKRYHEMVDSE
ncbi:hypothetical protein Enr13x_37370 [Stieleria neptunia]|uniref:DUF1778 domain-containing protein n=1 Tax=Stieleria neptunia TaxID=2527979 RepID=A0A518HSQ6_9BACT|nr:MULTISPECIES: DUF1778 domain-containing protein [Pirellulaceae]PAY19143.1 hypothetical protein CKO51_12305 [Rhodopirellula sp. SM50]QDV43877.1 hypothetical protein Enr13x_37370 [Stieleria neptunia]